MATDLPKQLSSEADIHQLLLTTSNLKPSFLSVTSSWSSATSTLLRLSLRYHNTDTPNPNHPTTILCKITSSKFASLGKVEDFFYTNLATQVPNMVTPDFYGSGEDAAGNIFLFLEDLSERCTQVNSTTPISTIQEVIKIMAGFHAQYWEAKETDLQIFNQASTIDVTRASNPNCIKSHENDIKTELSVFLRNHASELTIEETTFLDQFINCWADLFLERVKKGHITLIHGDLHPFGNIFLTTTSTPVFIDWAQCKRGIGPHDIMYLLLTFKSENRIERDLNLLTMYHHELISCGVSLRYTFDQCIWDFKFCMMTNLFQSLFQDSLKWFRNNFEVIKEWKSTDILPKK